MHACAVLPVLFAIGVPLLAAAAARAEDRPVAAQPRVGAPAAPAPADAIVTPEQYEALLCGLKVEFAELVCGTRFCEELEDGRLIWRSEELGEQGAFWYHTDGKIADPSLWPAPDCKEAWDAR